MSLRMEMRNAVWVLEKWIKKIKGERQDREGKGMKSHENLRESKQ